MSQLTRALRTLQSLVLLRSKLVSCQSDLTTVLDEAQNRPPDGGADGSIQAETWWRLKVVNEKLTHLIDSVDQFKI